LNAEWKVDLPFILPVRRKREENLSGFYTDQVYTLPIIPRLMISDFPHNSDAKLKTRILGVEFEEGGNGKRFLIVCAKTFEYGYC